MADDSEEMKTLWQNDQDDELDVEESGLSETSETKLLLEPNETGEENRLSNKVLSTNKDDDCDDDDKDSQKTEDSTVEDENDDLLGEEQLISLADNTEKETALISAGEGRKTLEQKGSVTAEETTLLLESDEMDQTESFSKNIVASSGYFGDDNSQRTEITKNIEKVNVDCSALDQQSAETMTAWSQGHNGEGRKTLEQKGSVTAEETTLLLESDEMDQTESFSKNIVASSGYFGDDNSQRTEITKNIEKVNVDCSALDAETMTAWSQGHNAHSFKVVLNSTSASERLGLCGSYWLNFLQEELILGDNNSDVIACKWPYKYIKRFGLNTSVHSFLIEAGRKCGSGEGAFDFHVIGNLDEVISALDGKSGCSLKVAKHGKTILQ